jgi:hypothetical protein
LTKKLLKLLSVLLVALYLPCAYFCQRGEIQQLTQSITFDQESQKCQNNACMCDRVWKKMETFKTDFRIPAHHKNSMKAPVFFTPVFAANYFRKSALLFTSQFLAFFWRQNPGLNLKTILRL